MQKTVKEIIELYDRGKLHCEHSTQRSFIYNNIKVNFDDGELTKAGNVIRSILQEGIQLPALYFWRLEDDDANIHYSNDEYNLHDGKQRFLSIYQFIHGNVVTRLVDKVTGISRGDILWNGLSTEEQNTILNYKFDIVFREGNQKEEETSFYAINTNSEPLTPYEALRGCYYGTFFTTFEDYITTQSKILTNIKDIGRGEQAIWLMFLATDRFNGSKEDKSKNTLISKLKDYLEIIRNTTFDPKRFQFDKKLELYNTLSSVLAKNKDKNPVKVCRIVRYVIFRHYDGDKVINFYKKALSSINDIASWSFGTHKEAIDKLCLKDIICDGRRLFSKEDKDTLIKQHGYSCKCCGKEFDYSKLTIDHIKPWSLGGTTTLDNASLLCQQCNSSKGAQYDEEGIYTGE